MVTLEQVRASAQPERFPRHVLDGCTDALVLFAAGFHGAQDAIWIAEAGMTATCVDVDHEKLGEMVLAYPEGWEYVHADAYEYARTTERQWDVVTVDCPSGHLDRCADLLPLWCSLARHAVVLGCWAHPDFEHVDGWDWLTSVPRSHFRGGVWWAVFEPC